MKKIFEAKAGGRVRKRLDVYRDGERYRLSFLILDRTNPTKEEKAQGAKEKRFEVLNEEKFIACNDFIDPDLFPLPELMQQFINWRNKQ